ncbi:unnamed protein product [Miscanthus lutarioriparius]|uniref:Uncharacterized protein n=1 Tax=Miscanthus lutarioriparius TaxID=422564 RepID=A0A811RH63_9POAL|nr:unnamed protein product [Miscanthus lutarioriparius]
MAGRCGTARRGAGRCFTARASTRAGERAAGHGHAWPRRWTKTEGNERELRCGTRGMLRLGRGQGGRTRAAAARSARAEEQRNQGAACAGVAWERKRKGAPVARGVATASAAPASCSEGRGQGWTQPRPSGGEARRWQLRARSGGDLHCKGGETDRGKGSSTRQQQYKKEGDSVGGTHRTDAGTVDTSGARHIDNNSKMTLA